MDEKWVKISKALLNVAAELGSQYVARQEAVSRTRTFKIAMLGGRRVGKTSALAAMYSQFEHVVGSTPLLLTVDNSETLTGTKLRQRLEGLMSVAADDLDARYGVDGDALEHRFLFYLTDTRASAHEASVAVEFQDYPGGWFDGDVINDVTLAEEYARVREFVSEADAIVIAIDTPYMVEADGILHEFRNRVARVVTLLADVFTSYPGEHLIVLVPLRCEKYVQTPEDRAALVEWVAYSYEPLLSMCSALDESSSVRIVTTPVETTGCLMFSHFENDPRMPNQLPVARFELMTSTFRPRYTDQPLRHLLDFAVRRAAEAREATVWGLFDDTSGLRSAISAFAAGKREGDGFGVLFDSVWGEAY